MKITIYDKNQKGKEYTILFSFIASDNNRYIIYYLDEEVFVSRIDEDKKLYQVSETMWPEIEQRFIEFRNQHPDGCEKCVCEEGHSCDCTQCSQ